MKYSCPLCNSTLSEDHYHKVIKIQAKREEVQTGELDKIRKQVDLARAAAAAAKNREKEIRLKAKADITRERDQAKDLERRKSQIRNKRLMARIQKLEEEREMLRKHTSPQELGLLDEKKLVSWLKREFPDDVIQHVGKGGDVIQFAKCNGEDAGCIIYECKRTDRISADHVQQAALAKKTRQATYSILVTTGTRKGFSGLDRDSGVMIVAPAGVLALAGICRESLMAMVKQRLDAAAKEAVANRLMDYVTSPVCRTPLEEAIFHTERARKNLAKEMRQHVLDWRERHETYQTIHCDVSHIQKNIQLVLDGDAPLELERRKMEPLALPACS